MGKERIVCFFPPCAVMYFSIGAKCTLFIFPFFLFLSPSVSLSKESVSPCCCTFLSVKSLCRPAAVRFSQ
jgi:hypothetical protein